MKADTDWPAPPRHGVAFDTQPQPDLKLSRAFAVRVLDHLACHAEHAALPKDVDGEPTLLPDGLPYGSPETFIDHFIKLNEERFSDEITAPLALHPPTVAASSGSWVGWASRPEVQGQVVLIERRLFHVLGPIRGDIVVFSDGHAAIVTYPQCSGCRHFKAVGFTPRSGTTFVPSVYENMHWMSTVHCIVRLVYGMKEVVA